MGAYDDLTDKIYDMWIFVQLKSGNILKIYDPLFDLRPYVKQKMNLLIDIEVIHDIQIEPSHFPEYSKFALMEGVFIEKYVTPKEWTESQLYDNHDDDFHALKTEDGYFRLYKENVKNYNLRDGQVVSIEVIRFDIRAWSQRG